MQLASCHWAYDQYISTQWHIYTLFTIVILIFRLYLHIYILQITPPSCSWYNNILACITELHIVTYISFLYIFFILPGSNIIGSGVPNLKIAIVGMLFWIFYNFTIALIINIYLYVNMVSICIFDNRSQCLNQWFRSCINFKLIALIFQS